MASGGDVPEHWLRIPRGNASAPAAAAPEMGLNRFVRFVALIERLGNALGTLAFTWATVVLLGGYSKDLKLEDDWFATTIVFLEATRFLSGLKLRICNPLRRAMSLWSPLVAILLMAPPLSDRVTQYIYAGDYDQYQMEDLIIGPLTRWIVFTALLVPVLLVTISRLRFPRIIKLVDRALGSRQVFWRRVITNLCMVAALGIQLFMLHLDETVNLSGVLIVQVCAFAVVSFGNFQIPAAVLRIVLAFLSLQHKYKDNEKNLEASLRIFYRMVLGQGMLYVVACMLEFFSFIPRRSLLHCGGFRGQWGVESVNMYYAYALEKCMQEGVFAPKKISLSTFAMDSLNSDSLKKQLNGIRTMHNFLQREPTKAQLYSEFTVSTKTMARIIRMLDWTAPKDTTIRLYAAKDTAELAKNIRVVTFPGTMQLLSALLDANSRPKRGNLLLVTDDEQEEIQDPFLNVEDSQEQECDAVRDVADNQGQRRDPLQDTDNLLETQNRSTQQACINKQNYILRCWQRISEFRLIPKEQLSTDDDLLPALAMSIIESLACCDQENCVEISNTADLIPKIIGFTSYIVDMKTAITKTQQHVLLKSSLKVLQRLTSIGGETGMKLRYKISKHPFLLTNLTDILGDTRSSQETVKLVAVILRNVAIDRNISQEIGRIQLINTMLMQAFLSSEGTTSTNAVDLLRKVAGQALAILTTESVENCLVMLKEPEFVKKLTNMILIHDGKYTYVAASLLRNLCLHTGHELRESDLKELSHALREVLERIIDAEGAKLEILIGLSSQICKVIPEVFTQELDDGQIKLRFVKRLVDALNANMKPSANCPGIRRVIIEQVIYLMECSSHYANCFKKCRMAEALLMVEQSVSKAENYRLFLGDSGFMEYSMPLSTIVARAKELLDRD